MKKLLNIFFFLINISYITLGMPTPALDYLISKQAQSLPETLSLERAATLNGYGYIFYKISPLTEAFINYAGPHKRFLEIGCGFSDITEHCLKKNVLEYTANDAEALHLQLLVARIKNRLGAEAECYLKKLLLLPTIAPDGLPEKMNYYNAILLDKVLHFFSPTQANSFFDWAYRALAYDGKLYILTISPYSSSFKPTLILEYENNKAQGNRYPGFIDKRPYLSLSKTDNPQYVTPSYSLFFKIEDLRQRLLEKQFIIEDIYALKLPRPFHPIWVNAKKEAECDLIGIVAKKIS